MAGFAEALRLTIAKHGKRPSEACRIAGVSRSSYHAWISGKRRPGLKPLLSVLWAAGAQDEEAAAVVLALWQEAGTIEASASALPPGLLRALALASVKASYGEE